MSMEYFDRGCTQCGLDIPTGATFFRLMMAEHKNTTRWYVSKRRILDMHICAMCYETVRQALIARRREAR